MHCTILCLSGKLIPARFASSCCPTNSVNVAFYVTRHRQVYHLSDNHTITTLNIVKFITCQVTTQSQLVNIVKFITCQVTTQSQLLTSSSLSPLWQSRKPYHVTNSSHVIGHFLHTLRCVHKAGNCA